MKMEIIPNMPSIYLDNSTTTKPSERSISQMIPFLTDHWGTPSQPHQKGQELFSYLTESYKTLYQFLGAKEEDQFVFTSSGAESVNHVISSVYREVTLQTGKNQFLISVLSEAPALMASERLDPLGCVSKMIDVDKRGMITAKHLAEAISPRTALVSIPLANGLTGVIQPLEEIIELCKQRAILLHVDVSHGLGKVPHEFDVDFITFSGDQMHAPKGTGGLFIKQGVKCSPFIIGGMDQGGMRAGPLNMPGVVSLASAAKEMTDHRDYICTEIARLRNKLEKGICAEIPKARPLFSEEERLPNCTCITFNGICNEALLFLLNRKKIYASIGGGNFQQLSLMLHTIGFNQEEAQGAISFNLSRYTTEEEIDKAIEIIAQEAASLLKVSYVI